MGPQWSSFAMSILRFNLLLHFSIFHLPNGRKVALLKNTFVILWMNDLIYYNIYFIYCHKTQINFILFIIVIIDEKYKYNYIYIYNMSRRVRRRTTINLFEKMSQLNINGRTRTFIAKENEIIQIIRERRFDPDERNNVNDSPLIFACFNRLENIALELIKTGVSNPGHANNNGDTALIAACYYKLDKVALELIKTGESNPGYCIDNGDTALIFACYNNLENVALELIKTGQSNPGHVNYNRETALLIACFNELENVAIELIKTGESNPGQINSTDFTALLLSCYHNLENVALELIKTGQSNPGFINSKEETALMVACYKKLENVAIELIKTGQSNPGHVNSNGDTSLIFACHYGLENVALELIKTGESNPGQTNSTDFTALMFACDMNLENVVFELIKTGQSKPDIVNNDGDTALIIACINSLENVALELIKTGQSNPKQISNNGESALSISKKNNLTKVINALKDILFNPINVNAVGFNTITQEKEIIKEHINEDLENNIVFMVNNNYYLSSKIEINKQLHDKVHIKYGCKRAGEGSQYIMDENINYNQEYFSLSSILGLQIIVPVNEIKKLIHSSYSSNFYIVEPTNIILPSIISKGFVEGSSGVSADHCQSGKETQVYTITLANITCGPIEVIENTTNSEEETGSIKILYKAIPYTLPIREDITIGELKTLFLNELINKQDALVRSLDFIVKFIYGGRIITQDDIMLKTIVNPPYRITLQAMVSPKTGGKRTRRHKKPKHGKKTRVKRRV